MKRFFQFLAALLLITCNLPAATPLFVLPRGAVANTNGSATNLTIVGASASMVTNTDFTASRVVVSDSAKRLTNSPVTTTELGYISGVTSGLQTQIDAKGAATNGAYIGGTFTTTTNSGATYFGSAWVTNSAENRIQLNSNLTALGAVRVGPNSDGWTLNAGDAAVQKQLYVGGAGVNSGYIASLNIQTGHGLASPGEMTMDNRDGVNRLVGLTWRYDGTRAGYVGWSGGSSTNNRIVVVHEDHGDGMNFQVGAGGGQNGFRWFAGANARYQMKLHPDVGGLAIGSSYYSTAPKTNGMNVEGYLGAGVTSPSYQLHVGGDAGINGAIISGTLTKTTNYTLATGDGGVVFVDASGGAVTITMQAAASGTIGKLVEVIKVDSSANAVNIAPNSGNTLLAGSTTNTTAQASTLRVRGYSSTAWIVNKTN